MLYFFRRCFKRSVWNHNWFTQVVVSNSHPGIQMRVKRVRERLGLSSITATKLSVHETFQLLSYGSSKIPPVFKKHFTSINHTGVRVMVETTTHQAICKHRVEIAFKYFNIINKTLYKCKIVIALIWTSRWVQPYPQVASFTASLLPLVPKQAVIRHKRQ